MISLCILLTLLVVMLIPAAVLLLYHIPNVLLPQVCGLERSLISTQLVVMMMEP